MSVESKDPLTKELTTERRHKILFEFNDTKATYSRDKCIHQLFEEQVEKTPDSTALIFEKQKLTYKELNIKANRLAGYLRNLGVGPEILVGICVERGIDMIVGLLGILKAGSPYVPLDPEYPAQRLKFMIEDSRLSIILTQTNIAHLTSDINIKTICIDNIAHLLSDYSDKDPKTSVKPDNHAYIIFTSGSTGKPKGVKILHKSVVNLLESMQKKPGFKSGDILLSVTTISFDLSVPDLFLAFSAGGTLVIADKQSIMDPKALQYLIEFHKVTFMQATPTAWRILLSSGWTGNHRLKALCGGEPLQPDLAEGLLEKTKSLWNMYGPTENTVWASVQQIVKDDLITIGRPMNNTLMYILSDNLKPVDVGVTGTLYIGGIGISTGYLNRPELTRERFIANPFSSDFGGKIYNTGDIARYLPDGRIQCFGRADHQVKIHGFRIELGEIEAALCLHPEINEAAVIPREDSPGDMRLASYIVFKNKRGPAVADLKDFLKQKLPDYMIPSLFVILDKLPLTPNGKIDRKALPAPDMERPCLDTEYIEPSTPAERLIADLWQNILGVKNIGIHDSFFELGGDSLKGAYFVSKLEAILDEYIFMVILFKAPTIAEIVSYIKQNYPEAFKKLTGHDPEKGKDIQESVKVDTEMIEKMRENLKRALMWPKEKEKQKILKQNPPAVFILAPPRSGSTLLRVMLAGHPKLFVPPELTLLYFQSLDQRQEKVPSHLKFMLDGTVRAIMEIFQCSVEEARDIMAGYEKQKISTIEFYNILQSKIEDKMLVDKTTYYPFHLDVLEKGELYFKDPLYIKLCRHPYGMVRSFEKLKLEQILFFDTSPFKSRTISELIWIICHQNISKFLKDIPESRKYTVRFEDIVQYPEKMMTEIAAFIGIKAHPDMWHPYDNKAKRMVDGLYGDSVSYSRTVGDVKFHGYKDINPEIAYSWKKEYKKDFLSDIARDIASDMGYELPKILKETVFKDGETIFKDFEITPDPENQNAPFPLTYIQQAYWVGRTGAFIMGKNATHRYMEIDSDNLDIERFQQAWRKLIDRHGMLRAVILPDGRQKILEKADNYEIKILDLRGKSQDNIKAELNAVRDELSHQILPTDRSPILEIRASRLTEKRYIIHLSLDALLFDISSRIIFFQEWEELYKNPDAALKKLDITFRDYVLGQLNFQNSKQYKRSKEYWLKKVPQIKPAPDLPLSNDNKLLGENKFRRLQNKLSKEVWNRLKEYGAIYGVTSSSILLGAYSEILKIWSRKQEFTLNLTIYNSIPLHQQVGEIIGDFSSLLLFSVDNRPLESFAESTRRLQGQLWEDMDHRYFCGIKVLREISLQKDSSYKTVLMPVVFTSGLHIANNKETKGNPTRWMGKTSYCISQSPQLWIDHQISEEYGELLFNWDTVEGLFPEGMIEDMFDSYSLLLNRLGSDKEFWEKTRPELYDTIIPKYHINQIAALNNEKEPVSYETLYSLFESRAKHQPNKTAVISSDKKLSYQQLYNISNQIGHRLRKMGAKPDTLIGVVMEKGWHQIAAVLGITGAGAAYLPIDPSLPEERIRYLLDYGQVNIVLTTSSIDVLFDWPDKVKRLCLDSEDFTEEQNSSLKFAGSADNLAYVIFTSGSTGLPKGVVIDHRGAVNTILDINKRFAVNSEDKVLALSSLSFDLSVYDIFGMLEAGGTIVVPEQSEVRDPCRWAALVYEHKVTIWNTVPALMGLMAEYIENKEDIIPDSLRLIMMSGDWIPLSLPGQIKGILPNSEVISLGGATEASIWSILYPIGKVESNWKSIPYGKPMKNQKFYVLNQELGLCPVWVPGQLYIGGIGVAKGYWRDKEKTDKSFIVHPRTKERLYKTGDLGRYLPDGNIEFLGREDFQLKIQGFRVETGEIQSALLKHPNISACVVTAIGDKHSDKKLIAYFVSEQKPDPQPEELRIFLKQKLPNYMIPSIYKAIEKLPLTSNGKVDIKALPALDIIEAPTKEKPVTSDSLASLTKKITGFVETILETDGITPDKNLLTLGVNSIDMIRIINKMENEFNFRLQVDELYDHPTIDWLVKQYEKLTDLEKKTEQKETALEDLTSGLSKDMLSRFDFIDDPEDRKKFEATRPGLILGKTDIKLLEREQNNELIAQYKNRRSCRIFNENPVAFEDFSRFLSCLSSIEQDGKPKYLYGSAGRLYPVQTYLYIKPEKVKGVHAGTYYYNPEEHGLILLSKSPDIPENIYDPLVNRPIFKGAAFAIFLIAQLAAIVPMYKERSLHYSVIEAGLMSQLMETQSPDFNIGLCQIGNVDFKKIKHLFNLNENHIIVHSFLGGGSVKEV